VPLDRVHANFYQVSIVTMILSGTISEI